MNRFWSPPLKNRTAPPREACSGRRGAFIHRVMPVFLLLCVFLSSCLQREEKAAADDLSEARQAFAKLDYLDAEKSFERYLRRNPDGADRWETWNTLLDIALTLRHDRKAAIEILESMRIEYETDHKRLRQVELQLAEQYRQDGKYTRAEKLWSDVVESRSVSPEDKAEASRGLAGIYLLRLEFELAKESLGYCLELPISGSLHAECLQDLAGVHIATDELPEAARKLQELLAINDISEAQRTLSTFMLADVLEQEGNLKQAGKLFESIHDTYPNKRVIEKRLRSLKEKGKKR